MKILDFYFAMSSWPFTFLEDKLRLEYDLRIYRLVRQLMERRHSKSYSKHFLYDIYRNLDTELGNFVVLYDDSLNPEELKFFRGLSNLTKNLKRFAYNVPAKSFPNAFTGMSTDDLKTFLNQYVKAHNFKYDQEVTLLATDYYIKLAQKVLPDAEKKLLN